MASGGRSETLTAYQAAVREIEHDSSNSGGDRGSHREQQTAATATAAATTAAAAAEEKPAWTRVSSSTVFSLNEFNLNKQKPRRY